MTLEELAREFHAKERVDKSTFQRRARVLQSIWREEQGYEVGEHRRGRAARPLGSRLPMPWARESLANYLTENIRQVVRREVLEDRRDTGKLFARPRIFSDLLSSQPLCFNLFGELSLDLSLATSLVRHMTHGRFVDVQGVDFEYSPGRSDERYTGDRSAFDVFLRCLGHDRQPSFLGIEVKYHENLQEPPADHRDRYDELAAEMGCFRPDASTRLRERPLQQIWRDHLLAGALAGTGEYQDAAFVFLFPRDNEHCAAAVDEYTHCLANTDSFLAWTMEEVVGALGAETDAEWVQLFRDRYLAFEKVDGRLNTGWT